MWIVCYCSRLGFKNKRATGAQGKHAGRNGPVDRTTAHPLPCTKWPEENSCASNHISRRGPCTTSPQRAARQSLQIGTFSVHNYCSAGDNSGARLAHASPKSCEVLYAFWRLVPLKILFCSQCVHQRKAMGTVNRDAFLPHVRKEFQCHVS